MAEVLRVDATVRFGGVVALDGLDLAAEAGEILGVIGPNGAGKTTLLNVISGFVRPRPGSLHLAGHDVTRQGPAQRARAGLRRTFQTPRLVPHLSVHENLDVAARHLAHHAQGLSPSEALAAVGLQRLGDEPAGSIAAGEQRFIELARCLVGRPAVLLLDEPATGLRDDEVDQLGRLLLEVRDRHDIAIVVVDHDMRLVLHVSDRVAVLEFGQLLVHGDPQDVRHDPAVISAYFGDVAVA